MQLTDFDAYLTQDSIVHCQQVLCRVRESPHPIVASELFNRGEPIIPDWYRDLLMNIRAHVAAEALPQLGLAPRPFVGTEEKQVRE